MDVLLLVASLAMIIILTPVLLLLGYGVLLALLFVLILLVDIFEKVFGI